MVAKPVASISGAEGSEQSEQGRNEHKLFHDTNSPFRNMLGVEKTNLKN